MIRVKIFEDWGSYIAKDEDGGILIYKFIPKLGKYQWENGDNIDNRNRNIEYLDLPMPWDKSLHKIIRDKNGFVVDLEPHTPDPREELKVDDKVWVWNNKGIKYPRYLSSYDKDKRGISTFMDGATSFSANGDSVYWEYWEKA